MGSSNRVKGFLSISFFLGFSFSAFAQPAKGEQDFFRDPPAEGVTDKTMSLEAILASITAQDEKVEVAYNDLQIRLQADPHLVLPTSFWAPLKRELMGTQTTRVTGCFRFAKIPDEELTLLFELIFPDEKSYDQFAYNRRWLAEDILRDHPSPSRDELFVKYFNLTAPHSLRDDTFRALDEHPTPILTRTLIEFLNNAPDKQSSKFQSTEAFVLKYLENERREYVRAALQSDQLTQRIINYLFSSSAEIEVPEGISYLMNQIEKILVTRPIDAQRLQSFSKAAFLNRKTSIAEYFYGQMSHFVLESPLNDEDRRLAYHSGLILYDSQFSGPMCLLDLPMEREEKLKIIRLLWPKLMEEDSFASSFLWTYGRYNSLDPEFAAEFSFLALGYRPALRTESSREFAQAFERKIAQSTSGFVDLDDDQFSVQKVAEAYLGADIRMKTLARGIILLRLTDSGFDEIVKTLESQNRADDAFELICDRLILSEYGTELILRKLKDSQHEGSVRMYITIPRWKNAGPLLEALVSRFEKSEEAQNARDEAVLSILSRPSASSTFSSLTPQGKYWTLSILAKRKAYSKTIVKDLISFLPSTVQFEELVGASLFYISTISQNLSDDEVVALKDKVEKALEIHVGPKVDESFIAILRSLKDRKPEWAKTLDAEIAEVKKGMEVSK